eukprot:g48964.t1
MKKRKSLTSVHYLYPFTPIRDLEQKILYEVCSIPPGESIHVSTACIARSAECGLPIYGVLLSYYQPGHLLVGWVEVNIQRDENRLEHPMWCLAGKNYLSQMMLKNVNVLFADYAPQIRKFVLHDSFAEHS